MNEMDTRFANQFNIQWFPGHMTKTLRMMEQEIQHVDASLVLLDARIPLSSLNPEIERITARKPKLYALNKADLADPAVTEEWIRYFRAADAGCVAISAKQKGGATAVKNAIEKELSGLLERREQRKRVKNGFTGKVLRWTGTKRALVELIYALDACGCLNKGTVDIKEIVAYFEYVFDIDLGDFYHTYMELKAKTKDRTGFLSTLKDRLLLRMREQD